MHVQTTNVAAGVGRFLLLPLHMVTTLSSLSSPFERPAVGVFRRARRVPAMEGPRRRAAQRRVATTASTALRKAGIAQGVDCSRNSTLVSTLSLISAICGTSGRETQRAHQPRPEAAGRRRLVVD